MKMLILSSFPLGPAETSTHHPMQYSAEVLTQSALNVIEQSVWAATPDNQYALATPVRFVFPCRSANNIIRRSNSQKSEKTTFPQEHHHQQNSRGSGERIQSV